MLNWTPFQPVPNTEHLVENLTLLPSHWSLTPLWEKRPYRDGWQNEAFIPHQEIAALLQRGEKRISKRTGQPYHAFCSGYGLRLGDVSGGLLALDIDGSSAENLLTGLAETPLPETVSWTSGKVGRRQLLYQVPPSYQEKLQAFRRKTITQWQDLATDAGELLEFRYNQHQSVLPPSFHRETGSYRWLISPEEIAVAIAPTWLCEFLISQTQPQSQKSHHLLTSGIRAFPSAVTGNDELSSLLTEATQRLSPQQIYHWSGHQFQEFGETWRGYCPRHQSQSGTAFSLNPNTGEWYCFGCEVGGGAVQYRHFLQGGNGTPRGKVFRSLVEALAAEAGLQTKASSQQHQTYQATHMIHQEYFDWETPTEGTVLAVKSSLGSGKTTWLSQVVSQLQAEGWLALGHRNSLLLQSCQRWGFIHLQTEQAFDLISVPSSQLALCVDSLHHFSPEDFAGKNIIIDEAIAVVTHLL
ncbi:MAG: bifunctional DNA primase/polymerase, partial [Halothece sp. Uz-M2-17]|nr:bifunctional DNA primase/polymerase [Halothece sp. Uz-M2-17]